MGANDPLVEVFASLRERCAAWPGTYHLASRWAARDAGVTPGEAHRAIARWLWGPSMDDTIGPAWAHIGVTEASDGALSFRYLSAWVAANPELAAAEVRAELVLDMLEGGRG
jgi:hypothetical protein